jgi:hypothetical protein
VSFLSQIQQWETLESNKLHILIIFWKGNSIFLKLEKKSQPKYVSQKHMKTLFKKKEKNKLCRTPISTYNYKVLIMPR